MLANDYQKQFERLINEVDWHIELPPNMSRFFQESGPTASIEGDQRRAARLIIRTRCVLIPESPLPAFPRERNPMGVFTSDLSRYGLRLVAPFQFYPEERVRIFLPTLWMQAVVVRARRLGNQCYQLGTCLITRHDPSPDAFDFQASEFDLV